MHILKKTTSEIMKQLHVNDAWGLLSLHVSVPISDTTRNLLNSYNNQPIPFYMYDYQSMTDLIRVQNMMLVQDGVSLLSSSPLSGGRSPYSQPRHGPI